ncbi:hypothetical protein F5Y19DRAFT_315655 [Xylariaceae sp. FL1651]|nr:hypothetical protein F5Y19DRAFT_315655 [Xylariaceae sp. FL1651]
MPVYEGLDDGDDGSGDNDGDLNDDSDSSDGGNSNSGGGGYDGPRQSYNFAPGYRGIVYRADVPDWGAGPRSRHGGQASTNTTDSPEENDEISDTDKPAEKSNKEQPSLDVHYKLQAMKWGLVPFWTKRNPGYGSTMKTINCRDDSLAQSGGMWSSMKARKRCIVIAQGFYEWLKKDGGREKMPHYVKRKDGKLMCFAGLWDVVQYENDEEKLYTYTIVTTDSNKQLSFLHDRMPVILENGSEAMRKWLDPQRFEWSKELQSLLKPYDGELDVYPVSKDVGKVGNNSPTFIIPIYSKENKSNIANFFAKSTTKKVAKEEWDEKDEKKVKQEQPEVVFSKEAGFVADDAKKGETKGKHEDTEAGMEAITGIKREADDELANQEPPKKLPNTISTGTHLPNKVQEKKNASPLKEGKQKISATSNRTKSPGKPKSAGTQKITKFFANSS